MLSNSIHTSSDSGALIHNYTQTHAKRRRYAPSAPLHTQNDCLHIHTAGDTGYTSKDAQNTQKTQLHTNATVSKLKKTDTYFSIERGFSRQPSLRASPRVVTRDDGVVEVLVYLVVKRGGGLTLGVPGYWQV